MERGPCAFKSRPDSVAEWLDALHLSRYKDAFDLWLRNATQGGAEVEMLPLLAGLTNAQLMEMGVHTVGHRKRLLIAASYINASPSSVIADTAAIQAGEPSNRECPPSPSCTGYPPSTVASSSQAEETEAQEVRTTDQVVEREDAEIEPPPGAPQPDGETPLSLRIRVALQRNVRPIAAVCLLLSIVFVYINPPTVAYAAIFVAAPTTLIASQQAENAMVMRGVLLTARELGALQCERARLAHRLQLLFRRIHRVRSQSPTPDQHKLPPCDTSRGVAAVLAGGQGGGDTRELHAL